MSDETKHPKNNQNYLISVNQSGSIKEPKSRASSQTMLSWLSEMSDWNAPDAVERAKTICIRSRKIKNLQGKNLQ